MEFIKNVCVVESTASIYEHALAIALNYGIAVYDALFLSLAEVKEAYLATLDEKLVNKIKNTKLGEIIIHPY